MVLTVQVLDFECSCVFGFNFFGGTHFTNYLSGNKTQGIYCLPLSVVYFSYTFKLYI